MASRVGSKGNIVINKDIRDRLGVRPGWETVQVLRDGHVEIHFLPPIVPGAPAGTLAPPVRHRRCVTRRVSTRPPSARGRKQCGSGTPLRMTQREATPFQRHSFRNPMTMPGTPSLTLPRQGEGIDCRPRTVRGFRSRTLVKERLS